MFKHSRYIHVQTPEGVKRGFTLLLKFAEQDTVVYTVAVCSRGDAFCRKDAREQCDKISAVQNRVRVVDLPRELAKLEAKCYGYKLVDAHDEREASNRWAWVWKYFL